MQPVPPVPLFFITGFLGAGKTTFLNRLLEAAAEQGKKIGVVVNEWGRVNIDAGLFPTENIVLHELNNGQVFCSCLSGDFVRALVRFVELPLDCVFVETSGMANPFPLGEILADMKRLTGHHYDYRGMTVLVDPESFLDLAEVVPAVEEQIIAGRRIVINKVDLVDAETVRRVREKIQELNPAALIVETSHARVPGGLDLSPLPSKMSGNALRKRKVKEPGERPSHCVVTTAEGISPERMKAFVRELLPSAFRIKGIVRDQAGGWFYVDGVNNRVETRALRASGGESKIVVISKVGEAIVPLITEAWAATCAVPFTVV